LIVGTALSSFSLTSLLPGLRPIAERKKALPASFRNPDASGSGSQRRRLPCF